MTTFAGFMSAPLSHELNVFNSNVSRDEADVKGICEHVQKQGTDSRGDAEKRGGELSLRVSASPRETFPVTPVTGHRDYPRHRETAYNRTVQVGGSHDRSRISHAVRSRCRSPDGAHVALSSHSS